VQCAIAAEMQQSETKFDLWQNRWRRYVSHGDCGLGSIGGKYMPSEDDLGAHVVVAEGDTVALKKYVAEREARLARTWNQIASRLERPPDQKNSPGRLLSNGA
jgi:hypothetical protein